MSYSHTVAARHDQGLYIEKLTISHQATELSLVYLPVPSNCTSVPCRHLHAGAMQASACRCHAGICMPVPCRHLHAGAMQASACRCHAGICMPVPCRHLHAGAMQASACRCHAGICMPVPCRCLYGPMFHVDDLLYHPGASLSHAGSSLCHAGAFLYRAGACLYTFFSMMSIGAYQFRKGYIRKHSLG